MAMILQGRLTLDVQFDGKSFPFSEFQELVYLHMVESLYQSVPSLSVCVKDNSRWLARNNVLSDGTKIVVTVSAGSDEKSRKSVFTFRKGAHKEDRRTGETMYTIDGWLDVPKYMAYAARKPVKGTSSSVLSKIASDSGMAYVGDGSNDTQTWYPMGRPLNVFASAVAKHGWSSNTSCMAMNVSLDKALVYRDVTAMSDPVAVLGLLDTNTEGVLPVTAFDPDTASGASNWQSGYGNVHVDQGLTDAAAQHTLHTNIGTQVNEQGSLQVNSQLRPAQARVTAGAPRVGNGHDAYARAEYQNRRVGALFSVSADAVVPLLTDLRCLDTVLVRTDAPDAVESTAMRTYSGLYRVIRRVVWITPGFLVEKLRLARRTLNTEAPSAVSSATASINNGTSTASSLMPAPVTAAVASVTSSLSEKVPPVVTTGTSPTFDFSKALEGLTSFKDTAVAAIVAVTAVSNGAADILMDKINNTDFKVRFDAVKADIASIQATGVAEIAAHKLAWPTDPFNLRPGMVASYKSQVQSAITAATPPLTRDETAARAAVEATTDVLSTNPWAGASAAQSGSLKAVNAQLGATRGLGAAEALAAQTELATTTATANATATAKQTATATAANTLQNTLDTWPAQLTAAKTTADAAFDAAA